MHETKIEEQAKRAGLPVYQYMRVASQRAMKLSAELNFSYHEPEEVARLFSELTGKPVGEGFCLFPPFYTDYGQNITVGKNVFINTSCPVSYTHLDLLHGFSRSAGPSAENSPWERGRSAIYSK